MATTSAIEASETLGEVTQAKIRVGLHTLFVILTVIAHLFDPRISLKAVTIVSVASFAAAFGLYWWAVTLQANRAKPSSRIVQRCASILSDNLFVTLVLAIGGQSTAGLWTIYLWTSIGYGVRYGIRYLQANVAVSTAAFALMAYLTPFWSERPPFVLGMTLGMILVPVYTGFLIRQLHKAVQERETAYKAKSEFLARMSHELRTPLHAIISTAELLRGKSPSEIQNDYVDTIALSSSTLLDLINRVLDLSKFESGQVGLAKEHINIHHLLADAANIFFQQGQQKNVNVRLYADPAIPLNLMGSPAHVREVLLNILGNAVKFTDQGLVSISAQVISDSLVTTTVRFEVVDTGCGIPQRDLARIFEPFMQSDQSITRKHGGTGLGTSFSREIIRLMGGEISISSVVGLGTTVRFSIPFNKGDRELTAVDLRETNIAILGVRSTVQSLKEKILVYGAIAHEYPSAHELILSLSGQDGHPRIDAVIVDADSFGHILPTIPSAIAGLSLSRIVPVIGIGDASLRTVAAASGYSSYLASDSVNSQIRSMIALINAFYKKGAMLSVGKTSRRNSRSLNVLVADDNATNRKIAKIALEDAGHRCTLVTNGDEALFALNDVAYDAALLDMHMPGRDGIEVAKIYRFAGFAREVPIPIILLTADCTMEAREEAEAAGISKFLTKPILPSEIVRTVEEVVFKAEVDDSSAGLIEGILPESSVKLRLPTVEQFSGDVGESEVINLKAIGELVSLMSKCEQTEFFSEFCEDAAGYIETLEIVNGAADVPRAREAMHALAGAASIIGAIRLSEKARIVEKQDAGAIVMNRSELLAQVRAAFEKTVEELSRLLLTSSS